MVDNASMKSWWSDYRDALDAPPQVWGIHNYGDVTYDRASYLEWLLAKVAQPVWVTETGGIVRLRGQAFQDEQAARASVEKAFRLADAHPGRVARLYLYQWQAAGSESFDAGLVDAFGVTRPALEAVRARLGEVPPRPEPTATPSREPDAGEREDTPAAGTTPGIAYAGMPTPGRGQVTQVLGTRPVAATAARRVRGGYVVTVRCPGVRPQGCRGHVSLIARGRGNVRLGSATVRVSAGATQRVRVRVPARRARAARSMKPWRLAAVLVLRAPRSLAETTWRT